MRNPGRYVLQAYANNKNIETVRTKIQHIVRVTYHENGIAIELAETNSLIEDEYSLNLTSASYLVEGTDAKEAMIHHHRKGHRLHHLQFKIRTKETIRIYLDQLDDADYRRCIEGFLHVTQDLIEHEQKAKDIDADLHSHFFNERLNDLAPARTFLLERVKTAYAKGMLTADEQAVDAAGLKRLRDEAAVRPFLEWKE